MKQLAIVTDSCADLTPEIADLHGITVVPLTVTIDGKTWVDGELSQAEFFQHMNASPTLPTTSQPPVGAFIEVYREALEHAHEVVSVHISSKLSGTISSALQAAEEFAGRVHVIDTLNLSWGEGLQVIEAAKAAAQGLDARGVIERVERARDRVQMIVDLDGLENLVKGGRMSKLAGAVGGMLNVRLSITPGPDGTLGIVRPYRGSKAALEHGLKWIDEKMGGARKGAFSIMHALAPERAEWLETQIRERYEVTDLYVVEVGVVIATHTGTGWGVAMLPED